MKAGKTLFTMVLILILILVSVAGCNSSMESNPDILYPSPTLGNNNGIHDTIGATPKPDEPEPTPANEPMSTFINEPGATFNYEPEEDIPGISKNYLILLETEDQINSVLEFKEYKESKGYAVTIKCVDQDITKENEIDASETIHKFLKEMDKELSLDYVLFIGNPYNKESACPQNTGGVIPMRYMYFNDGNHNTRYNYDWYNYEDPSKNAFNTPTDIYYAFDCDWDYDKDGYAGEFQDIFRYKNDIGEPQLMFFLGRIPFSDAFGIETVLKTTINYEMTRKKQSNALIASGILNYPESEKFPYTADGAYYADILSNNLLNNGIETVTLYEKSGMIPSKFECSNPLNYKNFKQELTNKYDLTYTFGHGGYQMMIWTEDSNNNGYCDEPLTGYEILSRPIENGLTGFFYMDGCHTMRVEFDTDSAETLHIQDFMAGGMNCAALATTRDSGFNPKEPEPRIVNYMFTDQTLIASKGFYEAAAKMIFQNDNLTEAYIYCYLGDPSFRLIREK